MPVYIESKGIKVIQLSVYSDLEACMPGLKQEDCHLGQALQMEVLAECTLENNNTSGGKGLPDMWEKDPFLVAQSALTVSRAHNNSGSREVASSLGLLPYDIHIVQQ